MNKSDIILLTLLFLAAFYLWSLPIQANPLPFGEGDAAWHFAIGDYIASAGKTITKLPNYVSYWYYNYNKLLGPGALEYPPSNHINYGLMQLAGGERFVPVSLFKAVTGFLGVFSTYFLIRRLYGTVPAFVAASGLVFSFRELMTYLWGQQPTLISFVVIPVVMYAFYQYLTSYFSGEQKPVYLYLTVLLLAVQFLLHIQGVIVSLAVLTLFLLAMMIKERKIPVSKSNVTHIIISAVIFAVISLPFYQIYSGYGASKPAGPSLDFSRLLSWSLDPVKLEGSYPGAFIVFSGEYSAWLLPFILLGIIFLVLRRRSPDILILSWLVGVYLMLHLDVLAGVDLGRIARMLMIEPPLFFSLMALGAFCAPNLLGFVKKARSEYLKYALSVIVFIIIIFTAGQNTFNVLNTAYSGVTRLTPAQYEAAEWMRQNLPEDIFVFTYGTLTYPKTRWILAVSQRHALPFEGDLKKGVAKRFDLPTYLFLDYSDFVALNARNEIEQLSQFESANLANATLVYDENDIKIYSLGVIKSN